MIRVDRTLVPGPASLSKRYRSGHHRGRTESEAIIHAYDAHVSTAADPSSFPFAYRAYKDPEVKQALHTLFRGKCAYCESRYAGTQPMDVEHWRPKAQVHEFDIHGNCITLGGYPWLAATWENLLPSCIDCNRTREQRDAETQLIEVRGKGNQFPVNGPRMQAPLPGGPPTSVDDALLLNPTSDDPSQHLIFRDDGLVTSAPGSVKGSPSIRVYALNRSELVVDRLGIAQLIEQRLTTIESLAEAIGHTSLPGDVRLNLQDLVAHEINALFEFARPDRPFSEMARQLIDQHDPHAHSTQSPQNATWAPQVASLLQRFEAHSGSADHRNVARRLRELGFVPNAPRTRNGRGTSLASYLRWEYSGKIHKARLYQNTTGLVSDSTRQITVTSVLPGAVGPADGQSRVSFPYAASSVDTVVRAAAKVLRWADAG